MSLLTIRLSYKGAATVSYLVINFDSIFLIKCMGYWVAATLITFSEGRKVSISGSSMGHLGQMPHGAFRANAPPPFLPLIPFTFSQSPFITVEQGSY